MADRTPFTETIHRLRWPLALTQGGMVAERLARAYWPLWSLVLVVLALLMLGVQDSASVELVWGAAALSAILALVFLIRGALRFRWPRREEALARLDASLQGRPLQTLRDAQVIGAQDAGSAELWRVHQARMAERARGAKRVKPDLRLSDRDPFGLRYIALLILMIALLFGSILRVGSVRDMGPGAGAAMASGPTWEGWVAPPVHTGLPVLYLADVQAEVLSAPQGSIVTLRLYGAEGAVSVEETVSGRIGDVDGSAPSQEFTVVQDGQLTIDGSGGREWDVAVTPDAIPQVAVTDPPEASVDGEMSLPFRATDDYGVEAGEAVITLDLDAIDRRYGLEIAPEEREAIRVPLPMPISGSRAEFDETLIEDFSKHPWANMPVTVEMTVTDAMGQQGTGAPYDMRLAARRFFDPLAAALIEMRRDLLWNRDNARRTVQVMRALMWQPEGFFRDNSAYLQLQVLRNRIETQSHAARLTDAQVAEHAETLWQIAVELEEGDLEDARERMAQAQERLNEAMKNGASDQEIAELMQELRDATDDYLRQLSQQAAREAEQNPNQPPMDMENAMRMNQDDIQRMMDRIQELMEQGRMAEAQQAMEELQQLMENMQVTQGQGGGQGGPGEQAMEGLAETLRDQQGLSDEAFRDLQEQFMQRPGQQGQQGQPGQQQPGQGQQGQGQGQQPGQGEAQNGQQQGEPDAGSLAQRQEQLRQELGRQRGNLPGAGSEAGQRARDALDEADRAMRGAEEALRDGNLAEAIDQQSQAMDALRDGIRQLGEELAEEQRQMRGQQGEAQGNAEGQRNDPLGRSAGSNGNLGNDQEMLQGEDVYRRAQELLDEIRRRSGETGRPEVEREYLERLLERF